MAGKRIPSQSAVPGFSRKQWIRFVASLTNDQCEALASSCGDSYLEYLRNSQIMEPPAPKTFTVTPPAPRLVGIELNPGPDPSSRKVRAAAQTAVKLLLGMKGKAPVPTSGSSSKAGQRSRRSPLKSKGKNGDKIHFSRSSSQVQAPVNIGTVMTNSVRHTPFVASGRAYSFTVASAGTTGNTDLVNHNGTSMSRNYFNLDPLGSGNTSINFRSFAAPIYNMASSFLRYRFRKLKLLYIPLVSTSTTGSVTLAVTPECVFLYTNYMSFGPISSLECSISGPAWSPMSLDCMAYGGFGANKSDWLHLDSAAVTNIAEARLESPGSVCVSLQGNPSLGTPIGQVWLDYEIEFEGVGQENAFYSDHTAQTGLPESSSSPPVAPPTTPFQAPEAPLYMNSRPPSLDVDDRYVHVGARASLSLPRQ